MLLDCDCKDELNFFIEELIRLRVLRLGNDETIQMDAEYRMKS